MLIFHHIQNLLILNYSVLEVILDISPFLVILPIYIYIYKYIYNYTLGKRGDFPKLQFVELFRNTLEELEYENPVELKESFYIYIYIYNLQLDFQ